MTRFWSFLNGRPSENTFQTASSFIANLPILIQRFIESCHSRAGGNPERIINLRPLLNSHQDIQGILGNFAKVSNSLFDQTILQDVFFVALWVNRVDNLGMDN